MRREPSHMPDLPISGHDSSTSIAVLIPVYDDWTAVTQVVADLDHVLASAGLTAALFLVDDGSTIAPESLRQWRPGQGVLAASVIRLRRNVGHQRAICVGLAYLEAHHAFSDVVVMDADGEDDPRDVPRLLALRRSDPTDPVVFAERRRRSEGALFVLGYAVFRMIHWLLTGRRIRVGNFSVVPRRRLTSLVAVPELWNHYAAAIVVSRQPHRLVPTSRAKRVAGQPTMTYTSLVIHGLSAISVFVDVVVVRLIAAGAFIFLLGSLALAGVVAIRLLTDLAIAGWTTYSAGLLLVILFQTITFGLLFCFTILMGRKGATILPMRDYPYFIAQIERIGASSSTV